MAYRNDLGSITGISILMVSNGYGPAWWPTTVRFFFLALFVIPGKDQYFYGVGQLLKRNVYKGFEEKCESTRVAWVALNSTFQAIGLHKKSNASSANQRACYN
jgi:hypothetical protein